MYTHNTVYNAKGRNIHTYKAKKKHIRTKNNVNSLQTVGTQRSSLENILCNGLRQGSSMSELPAINY